MKQKTKNIIPAIVITLFIIILVGSIYHTVVNFYNENLEVICIDNGYKKLTDYKIVNVEEIWVDSEYIHTFMIECDKKVLNSQYSIKLTIIRNCAQYDKWGECEYYNRLNKYDKPYKSLYYIIKK